MPNIEIFRPKSGLVYGCVALGLDIAYAVNGAFYSEASAVLPTVSSALLLGTLSWVAFIRPKLEFTENYIKVVNPFVTELVSLHEVDSIDTRWNMNVVTGDRSISAWVAPAPTRRRRKIHPNDLRGLANSQATEIRASDAPNTLSGDAAHIARVALNNLRNSRVEIERIDSKRTLNAPALLTVGVSLVGLALSVVLHF